MIRYYSCVVKNVEFHGAVGYLRRQLSEQYEVKWLRRLTGASHALAWNYTAEGQIWRLIPSARGPLVIEERNTDRKEVLFTSLDAQTGVPMWSNAQFRDRWWHSKRQHHFRQAGRWASGRR